MNTESSSQLLEVVLSEMKNKSSADITVNKNTSFADCEAVRYKLWAEYKVEIHAENKRLVLSVYRK